MPTHPDRVGGLGFVERFATIYGPVAFVFSAVIASQWAHQVMFHDLAVGTLKAPAAAFLVVALIVFLAPLAVFAGPLSAARKRAELEYGALIGRHGAGVRRRWILGERIDDDLLSAPEIGPVADTAALYESVTRMRPLPIGKRALIAIALPALVPILLVFAIKVPLAQILGKLLKGLV